MNLMNLVQLIGSWKQRRKSENFKEYTTDTPVVHLMIVVAISQEALRWSVPSRGDILCEWRLGVDTPAGSKIGKLNYVSRN